LVTLIVALRAWSDAFAPYGPRVVPWWLELGKVIPLAVEVAVVAGIGVLFKTLGGG